MLCWTLLFVALVDSSLGRLLVRRDLCSRRDLAVKNGNYRLVAGNQIARFTCDDGFSLYGKAQIVCFGSKWSSPAPKCIGTTCRDIPSTTTLKVTRELDGAMLKFSCAVMYKLEGVNKIICDGEAWSDNTPLCKKWDPPKSCDFEAADICGWSQHDADDRDWTWNTGETPTKRTGPPHDHTLGADGAGHYMYFETSSPTRTDHTAVLMSPLYPANYSGQCFHFWYHILGTGDISEFSAHVVSSNFSMDQDLNQPLFHGSSSMGPDWQEYTMKVYPRTEPFQIIFVAKRGSSYRSDFALDDVALQACPGASTTTSTVATTKPPTTQKPSTTTTTVPPPPSTTFPATTTKPVTSPRPTTTARVTTTTARATTTTATKQTKASVGSSSVETTTKISSKRPTGADKTTTVPMATKKPLGSRQSQDGGEDEMQLAYILVGVGLVVAIIVVVAVVIACFRRDKFRRQRGTMSSVNPLYTAMGNNEDEMGVQFEHQYDNFR